MGGGISQYGYYEDTALILQGGSIIENEADYGGGIYWNSQEKNGLCKLILEGGTVGENHAIKGDGIYKEGNTNGGLYGISLGSTQINQEIYLGPETVKMYMISSPTDTARSFPLTVDPQAAKMGLVVVSPDNEHVTNAAQYLRSFYLKDTQGYALVKSGKDIILGQAFFVDGVNGKDTNKGNSPENAFLTVNRAIEALGNDPGTVYVCGTVTVNGTETWEMKDGQSLTRYEGENVNGTSEDAFRGNMIVIGDGAELTMNRVTVYGSLDQSSEGENGYLLVQGGNLNISSDSSLEDGTVYLKDGKTVTVTGSSENLLMEIEKENPVEGDNVGRYQTPKTANAVNFRLSERMSGFVLIEDADKNNVVLEKAYAVYVDGVNGSDANDGTTPETALRTLRQAYETIKSKGGILYIVDTVSISDDTKLTARSYQDDRGTVETFGTVCIMRYNGNKNPLFNINSGITILSGIRIDGGGTKAEVHTSPLVNVGVDAVLYVEQNAQLTNNHSTGDGGAINNRGTVHLSSCRIGGNTASKGSAIYQAGILNIESAKADIGEEEIYFAEGAFMNIRTRLARETVFNINMDSSDAAEGRTVAVFSEDALGGGSVEAQKIHFYVNPLATRKTLSVEGSDTLVLSKNFAVELVQTEFFRKIGQNVTFNVVPRNVDPSEVTVTVKNGEDTVPCTVKDYNRYKKISLEVTEETIGMLTLEIQLDDELVEKSIIVSGYDILYAKDQQALIAKPQENSGAGVHTDTAQIVVYNGADEARGFDAERISICYDDDSDVRIDNDAVSRNMEDAMKCFGFDVDITTEIPANGVVSMPVVFSNGDNLTEAKEGTITLENAVFGTIWTKIDLRYETRPFASMQVCVYLDDEITTEPDVYVVNKTTGEKIELTKIPVKTSGTVESVINEFMNALGAARQEQVWPYQKTGIDEGDYKLYVNDMDTGKELQVREGRTVSQKINLYTVTYVLNGGEFKSERENSDIYIEGIGLSELPSPRRESARFAGWFEDEDFTTETSIGKISTESKKPYILYAAWTMQDEWTDVNLGKTEYLEEMGSSFTLEAEIEGALPDEITVQVLQETTDGKTRTVPAKVTDSGNYKLITVEVNPENIGSLTLLFEQKDEDGVTLKEMERTVELSAYEVSYANGLGYLLAAPQEDGIEEIHTDRAAITVYNGSRDAHKFSSGSWEASYEGNVNENVWIDNSMVDKNMSEKNAMRYFGMTLEQEASTEIKPGEKATFHVIFSNGDMLTENRSGVITMKNAGLGNAAADIPLNFRVRAITRFQLQLQLNDEMADEETVELQDNNGRRVTVNKMRTGDESTLVLAYRVLTGKTDIRWNYQLTNIVPGSYRLFINGKDANRRIQVEEGKIIQEKVDMYSIRYELNEGIIKEEMPSYYIKGAVQALPRPEKEKSQFAGWYTSGTFSGNAIWEIGATTSGILKLYAKWEEITAQAVQVSRETRTENAPKTSDVKLIIVDIAFVGGIACLAKMFLTKKDDTGMDEEDKERRVRSIIENAKGRGMLAGIGAAGMIFVTLLFYYTLGMKDEVRREIQK